jgi:sugar/nucleoside kinase (ribokinase family)
MLEPQIAQLASRVPVSFDFGQRLPEYWEPLIGAVTVAFFSAGSLDSTSAEKLARRAAARGPRFIVVTEGPRGALVVEGDELHRALPVADTVLDTVGAGDSLIGTMLAAILLGKSPQEALDSASAAAAITCGTYGAFSHGVPMASPVYWPDLDGDGVATTSHLRSNTEEVAGR